MQVIDPLKVPWKVTYSTLFSIEILEEHDIRIHFDAVFLDSDEISDSKPALRNEKLSCLFEIAAATRSHPAGKDDDVIDRTRYDWGNLTVPFDDGKPTATDYFKRYYSEWTSSRLNPDPNFYVVKESEWLREERERGNWYVSEETKHYLFLGGDFSFEALAKNLIFPTETSK